MAEDGASSNTSSVAFQEQDFQEISKKRIRTISFQINLAHVRQTYPLDKASWMLGKAVEMHKFFLLESPSLKRKGCFRNKSLWDV